MNKADQYMEKTSKISLKMDILMRTHDLSMQTEYRHIHIQ